MAIKTYKKGSNEKLSEHFRAYEFDCNCSRCSETLIDEKLVDYLEQIREHFGGKPISPTGYRCPEHNAEVPNAAKKSKHIEGMAADITIDGVKPAEIAKYAESIGILGIGLYEKADCGDDFVHIDTRTAKGFWYGHAQAYRSTFGGYSLQSFVRDVQAACGAAVDGIAGAETLSKTVTISAVFNRSHAAVKAVQMRLATLGYDEVGTADGVAGPKFTSALAHFQEDNGCTPTGIAEEWGKTWQKLLGMA